MTLDLVELYIASTISDVGTYPIVLNLFDGLNTASYTFLVTVVDVPAFTSALVDQ